MKISREGSLSDTEKQKGLPSTEKQDEDYDSMSYTKNKRDEYLLAIRKKKNQAYLRNKRWGIYNPRYNTYSEEEQKALDEKLNAEFKKNKKILAPTKHKLFTQLHLKDFSLYNNPIFGKTDESTKRGGTRTYSEGELEKELKNEGEKEKETLSGTEFSDFYKKLTSNEKTGLFEMLSWEDPKILKIYYDTNKDNLSPIYKNILENLLLLKVQSKDLKDLKDLIIQTFPDETTSAPQPLTIKPSNTDTYKIIARKCSNFGEFLQELKLNGQILPAQHAILRNLFDETQNVLNQRNNQGYWLQDTDLSILVKAKLKNDSDKVKVTGMGQLKEYIEGMNDGGDQVFIVSDRTHWTACRVQKHGADIKVFFVDSAEGNSVKFQDLEDIDVRKLHLENLQNLIKEITLNNEVHEVKSVLQNDSSSCGIFALENAIRLTRYPLNNFKSYDPASDLSISKARTNYAEDYALYKLNNEPADLNEDEKKYATDVVPNRTKSSKEKGEQYAQGVIKRLGQVKKEEGLGLVEHFITRIYNDKATTFYNDPEGKNFAISILRNLCQQMSKENFKLSAVNWSELAKENEPRIPNENNLKQIKQELIRKGYNFDKEKLDDEIKKAMLFVSPDQGDSFGTSWLTNMIKKLEESQKANEINKSVTNDFKNPSKKTKPRNDQIQGGTAPIRPSLELYRCTTPRCSFTSTTLEALLEHSRDQNRHSNLLKPLLEREQLNDIKQKEARGERLTEEEVLLLTTGEAKKNQILIADPTEQTNPQQQKDEDLGKVINIKVPFENISNMQAFKKAIEALNGYATAVTHQKENEEPQTIPKKILFNTNLSVAEVSKQFIMSASSGTVIDRNAANSFNNQSQYVLAQLANNADALLVETQDQEKAKNAQTNTRALKLKKQGEPHAEVALFYRIDRYFRENSKNNSNFKKPETITIYSHQPFCHTGDLRYDNQAEGCYEWLIRNMKDLGYELQKLGSGKTLVFQLKRG